VRPFYVSVSVETALGQIVVTHVKAEIIAALAVIAVGSAPNLANRGSWSRCNEGGEREDERRAELHAFAIGVLRRQSSEWKA
jgi:hypothetical protein